LIDTPKPIEVTEDLKRFRLDLPAGKTRKLRVKSQATSSIAIQLVSADEKEFKYCTTDNAIPKAVRDAVAKLMRMRAAIAETNAQASERRAQVANITVEQTRIRENMKTVNQQQSEYYTRLLKKLNDQESEIEKLQGEATDLLKTAAGQKKELDDYLSGLTVQ
jgi:chromosome segregation ATPase